MAYNHKTLIANIERRLAQDPRIHLQTLAQELHVHRHTINRALIGKYGASFRSYQRALIAQIVIRRLHESEVSCKQLATELGYEFSESLTRFVRGATGRTPKQLREQGVE
jgi:AraC-like DNA-binding protein